MRPDAYSASAQTVKDHFLPHCVSAWARACDESLALIFLFLSPLEPGFWRLNPKGIIIKLSKQASSWKLALRCLILDSVISTFYQPTTLLLQCYQRELTKISDRPPGSPAAQALTEHVPGDQGVSICINLGHECKPLSVMGAGRMAQGAVAFLLMLMA